MLSHPGERLGAREALPGEMRRGRRELRHQDRAVALAEPRVESAAEPVAVAASEHLRLRRVGQRVELEEVRGRAVRLVVGLDAARAAPRRPLRERLLHEDVAQRLPEVALHAGDRLRIADAGELGEMVFETIAAILEEEAGKLVRPGGAVVFERIVESRARKGVAPCVKGREELQVRVKRGGRERVQHRAGVELLGALHGLPGVVGDEAASLALPERPRPLRRAFTVLQHLEPLDAEFLGDGRPSEAPAGAEAHVDLHALRRRETPGIRHPVEELRGHERGVAALVPLRAVDRHDAVAAQAGLGPARGLLRELLRLDGVSEPMADSPGTRLGRRLREGRKRGEARQRKDGG